MPIINSIGGMVAERFLTKEDIYLRSLVWPRDEILLMELSPRQFKAWIYALDPRQAMLFSGDRHFQLVRDMKLKKWSFIWNLLWV